MNALDDLKRAAIAYGELPQDSRAEAQSAVTVVMIAAQNYYDSLANFGPGLDPAPPPSTAEALAREVLEARPPVHLWSDRLKWWHRAAETLSRAYLDAVGRVRALEAVKRAAEDLCLARDWDMNQDDDGSVKALMTAIGAARDVDAAAAAKRGAAMGDDYRKKLGDRLRELLDASDTMILTNRERYEIAATKLVEESRRLATGYFVAHVDALSVVDAERSAKDARIAALETLLRRARQYVLLAHGEGAEALEREIDAAIPRGADE